MNRPQTREETESCQRINCKAGGRPDVVPSNLEERLVPTLEAVPKRGPGWSEHAHQKPEDCVGKAESGDACP